MEDPYPVENIDRLGDLMFQTSDNSQLMRRVLWINVELTIVSSLKHKNTQPIYIFNRENPQNFEPQNVPRRRLDFIALNFLQTILSFLTPAPASCTSTVVQSSNLHHKSCTPYTCRWNVACAEHCVKLALKAKKLLWRRGIPRLMLFFSTPSSKCNQWIQSTKVCYWKHHM